MNRTQPSGLVSDSRGASEGVAWIMAAGLMIIIMIAAVFQAWVIFAGASDTAKGEQADFVSERLAASIEGMDREVRNSPDGLIRDTVNTPTHIAGESYSIEIVHNQSMSAVIIELNAGDVRSVAEFRSETAVEEGYISGGNVEIVREGGAGSITIRAQ